ncbi:MAG: radical SAM protein [Desulfobacterales bacterium]|nr:radical SAM protein [Desulfobacterales bacterium]
MKKVLLVQLPIQKLNYGMKTGNIPMGAASLKTAYDINGKNIVTILDEKISSYLGDSAIIKTILESKPDIVGFTVFSWNLERSKYISKVIKKKTGVSVIFGGPEITEDNNLSKSEYVDFYVYGEGEEKFCEIIDEKPANKCLFEESIDPYLTGILDFKINGTMLLETMRGCPYTCGYCYYNKSRSKLSFRDEKRIIESVKWAVENKVEELYLLDPSLNIRPDLKKLLKQISLINNKKIVGINSEIRADKIDSEDANLFNKAGFTGFETGLQTTNEIALEIMKRKTDLKSFIKGINLLKERDIVPRIDLILGLPGDNYEGFKNSILFINENNMFEDVQVFPLSVLPGTDFRKNSEKLGLNFEKEPPYTVISTPTFSRDEMLIAIDNTENLFDMALFPLPDLDLSLDSKKQFENDVFVNISDEKYVSKIVFNSKREIQKIEEIAENLTNPYQVIFSDKIKDFDYILDVLNVVSLKNPYTPFEVIMFEPSYELSTTEMLENIMLKRPQFLDNDLRLQYNKSGNRSVLFTVVSQKSDVWFFGEMKRQVFWWNKNELPNMNDLQKLDLFDAIYIETNNNNIENWIDDFVDYAEDNFFISFSSFKDQKIWFKKTSEDYYFDVFPEDNEKIGL